MPPSAEYKKDVIKKIQQATAQADKPIVWTFGSMPYVYLRLWLLPKSIQPSFAALACSFTCPLVHLSLHMFASQHCVPAMALQPVNCSMAICFLDVQVYLPYINVLAPGALSNCVLVQHCAALA